MKLKGNNFKYTFNGESKTADEIKDLIDDNTIAFVDGLTVNYFSPKKKVNEINDLVGAYDFKLPVTGTIYDTNNKEDLKILEFLGFSAQKKTKIEEILEEVEKHQEQNGGRIKNVEFPPNEGSIYSKLSDFKIDEDYCEKYLDAMCGNKKRSIDFTVGVKHNKFKAPLDVLQTTQFPKALQLLALATAYGNKKYKETDKDFLNFKRVDGGYQTYLDASARHSTDRLGTDKESELPHFVHAVWNQLAALQMWIDENDFDIEEYSKDYLEDLYSKK